MLKCKIVMDEEKLSCEGRYEFSTVLSTIDSVFANSGLPKVENGVYIGRGRPEDYARFWSIIWALAKKDWFMQNVKEWLWYNSDDGSDENDFSVEDILAFCKENPAGIGA